MSSNVIHNSPTSVSYKTILTYVKGEAIMFVNRQGLIAYVHSVKQAKALRKYGNVQYVSRELKYVVLYCNQDGIEKTMERIQSLPFVKKILLSYRPELKTEFENSKPDKAKEYDYKIGI